MKGDWGLYTSQYNNSTVPLQFLKISSENNEYGVYWELDKPHGVSEFIKIQKNIWAYILKSIF